MNDKYTVYTDLVLFAEMDNLEVKKHEQKTLAIILPGGGTRCYSSVSEFLEDPLNKSFETEERKRIIEMLKYIEKGEAIEGEM